MKTPYIDIAAANSSARSVILISHDDAVAIDVNDAMRRLPNITLEARTATLTSLNGAAVKLAASNDLMIFQTSGSTEDDLGAIAQIRKELDRSAKLLALTGSEISLADARRLTRAGVDEVLTFPFDKQDFCEQVERWTTPNALVVVPPQSSAEVRSGKVIAVAKSRGGVGATTICVNLADGLLGRKGILRKSTANRVVLLDLDFQFGAIASFVDIDARDGLFHLAIDGARPDSTFLHQSIVTTKGGIDVLTAPSQFAPLDSLKPEQIATIIELLRAEYDFVVVDLPHALVDWVSPVLAKADRLLLVSDSTVPAIRQARRLIDFYTADNFALQIEILINGEKKPFLKSSTQVEAEKILDRPLKHWLPSDPKTARAAVDRGTPLAEVSSRSPLAKAIGTLAAGLARELVTPAATAATRPSASR